MPPIPGDIFRVISGFVLGSDVVLFCLFEGWEFAPTSYLD